MAIILVYKELPSLFYSRLAEVVNMVLEVEIPQLRDVETAYTPKIIFCFRYYL